MATAGTRSRVAGLHEELEGRRRIAARASFIGVDGDGVMGLGAERLSRTTLGFDRVDSSDGSWSDGSVPSDGLNFIPRVRVKPFRPALHRTHVGACS